MDTFTDVAVAIPWWVLGALLLGFVLLALAILGYLRAARHVASEPPAPPTLEPGAPLDFMTTDGRTITFVLMRITSEPTGVWVELQDLESWKRSRMINLTEG